MILCIDTLSPKANVTLLKENDSPKAHFFDPFASSEETLKAVEILLIEDKKNLVDLKKIALITGPGSFTGLRVGLSIANTLALELNLETLGLTTDQWWQGGVEEKDWIYVQSMNPAEVYVVGFGRYALQVETLMEVTTLPNDIPWSGVLSSTHRQILNENLELKIADVAHIWEKSLQIHQTQFKKREAIEAFYLKKPKITETKRN